MCALFLLLNPYFEYTFFTLNPALVSQDSGARTLKKKGRVRGLKSRES